MRSGLQAGTTGRGGGLGGEALLNGWGRQEMSSAVAWRNTDARTQVVARTNCQRYRMIGSLTRGEEGLGHR